MLLQDMYDIIDLRMDEANLPWFNEDEKDKWLNQAQGDIVRNMYKQFEVDEYSRQILARLVEPLAITFAQTGGVGIANIDTLAIPNAAQGSRLMFILSLQIDITDLCGDKYKRMARPQQIDDSVGLTNDPFNEPSSREPSFIVEDNGAGNRLLRLYVTGDNATQFPTIGTANTLRVLRSPRNVSNIGPVESELPDLIHDTLVERAVTLMLENVEAGRLTTHSLTSQIDEP